MTDSHQHTPLPQALERDALIANVIDASPLGGVLTDDTFEVIHASAEAIRILGLRDTNGHLPRLVRQGSQVARPDLFESFVGRLGADGAETRSHHIVEAGSDEPRCIAVEAARCQHTDRRWIFWIEDITEKSHLPQFQLLAEIGRSKGADVSTQRLAERLVDALVRILGVDIAVITLADRDGLRPVATRGLLLEDGYVLHARDRPSLAQALQTKRPVVGDGSEWDAAEQEMTGTHYIVPLVASGVVLGTLHVGVLDEESPMSRAMGFSAVLDLAFFDALSGYAGAAIANARLFEEVREERLKLKTVVDFIPEGVILYTAAGDVLAFNDTARAIAERNWINLNTDSRPYRLLDAKGNLIRRVDWPFFRLSRDGVPILGEEIVMDFGAHKKVLSINVVPVPSVSDESIPTYVGTLRDITLERERQTEREGFLQVVSHEMRSPLTPLTGFLQMVRKQVESGEAVDAELIRRAELQVQRLARLVDRVLDLSRLERAVELSTQTLDLRDVARSAGAIWQSDPRGVAIDVVVSSDPVLVDGDADRLDQVLTNLIDNAVKHSPRGATVEVEVHNSGGQASMLVRDRGRGVTPNEMPHIFDRFFSGSAGAPGMGIGLYITRQLVTAHGGEIRVTSQPDVCTTFEVVLPSVSH